MVAILRALEPLDARPSNLDLIAHSTRGHQFLRLGESVLDMGRPQVRKLFRALAADSVLARLNVGAVRLLACGSAMRRSGLRTMALLSHALRLPVFGTTKPILKHHFDADGFDPAFVHLLRPARVVNGGLDAWGDRS
jgi:hypothetical protein